MKKSFKRSQVYILNSPTLKNPEILFFSQEVRFMTNIQNITSTFDPFADAVSFEEESSTKKSGYVHIRVQQRNGKKCLTTVQGIFFLKKKLINFLIFFFRLTCRG